MSFSGKKDKKFHDFCAKCQTEKSQKTLNNLKNLFEIDWISKINERSDGQRDRLLVKDVYNFDLTPLFPSTFFNAHFEIAH